MAFSLFYCTIDCTIDQSFWKQKAKVEIIISAINNRYISVVCVNTQHWKNRANVRKNVKSVTVEKKFVLQKNGKILYIIYLILHKGR